MEPSPVLSNRKRSPFCGGPAGFQLLAELQSRSPAAPVQRRSTASTDWAQARATPRRKAFASALRTPCCVERPRCFILKFTAEFAQPGEILQMKREIIETRLQSGNQSSADFFRADPWF